MKREEIVSTAKAALDLLKSGEWKRNAGIIEAALTKVGQDSDREGYLRGLEAAEKRMKRLLGNDHGIRRVLIEGGE